MLGFARRSLNTSLKNGKGTEKTLKNGKGTEKRTKLSDTKLWKPLAMVVLEGAYRGTLAAALRNHLELKRSVTGAGGFSYCF